MDERLLKDIYDRFQPPLSNPAVSYEVVGPVENVTYTYVVTVVGDSGETNGTRISFKGPSYLTSQAYIKLSWTEVEYAKKYRVYGREGGANLGLIVETEETQFTDYGVIVPDTSKKPPSKNTTGRLGWNKVVFLPGRYAQSAEVNELQSIIEYHQGELGRTLFRDGDIISGCSISVSKDKRSVTISGGKVFLRGRIRQVQGKTLSINGTGTEIIGLKVEKMYVDADDDSILLDPAQTYPGYGTPGALREILLVEWVKDQEGMIPVYELLNGVVVKAYTHTMYSELEKTLAVRTHDISGHTVVSGLTLTLKPHAQRRDKLVFVLSSGKAYVEGYEIYKPMTVEWEEYTAVDYATTTEIVSPRKTGSYVYELDARPVRRVTSVVGSFFQADTRVIPNIQDEQGWYVDTLPYPSIDEVVGVWNNSSKSQQYQPNTHYRVVGNTLRFNPSYFSPGNSYYVEYYYFSELLKGTRELRDATDSFPTDGTQRSFTLSHTNVTHHAVYFPVSAWLEGAQGSVVRTYKPGEFSVNLNRGETDIGYAIVTFRTAPPSGYTLKIKYYYWHSITEGQYVSVDSYLTPSDPFGNYLYEAVVDKNVVDLRTSGTKPSKSSLIVTYEYFLPQRAYLLLNRDGDVMVLRGAPSLDPKLPTKPVGLLPLYELYFPAFGAAGTITTTRQSRYQVMRTYDMNVLRERFEKVAYDLALTELEVDAISKETPSPKKAIFTDPFRDAEKMEYEKCQVSIDSNEGVLLLPTEVRTYIPLTDYSNSTCTFKGFYALKSYTRAPWIEQLCYNDNISLNPYGVIGPFGVLTIYPSSQFWYEKKVVDEIAETLNLTFTATPGTNVDMSTVREWVARTLSVDPNRVVGTSSAQGFSFQVEGRNVLVEASIVPTLKPTVVYCRLKSMPDTWFECYLGSNKMYLSLPNQNEIANLGWTVAGTTSGGNGKTDGNGNLTVKFYIPSGVKGGEVDVVFKSTDEKIWCSTKYRGFGKVESYKREMRLVNVTVTRPLSPLLRLPRATTYVDPVAQTFLAPCDGFIESIDVWFYAVPETEELVALSIRKTLAGMPTDEVIGRSVKTTTEILQEANIDSTVRVLEGLPSETNGKVRFVFDPPVFVEGGKEYAFTLDNSNAGFFVCAAKVGKRVLTDLSGKFVPGKTLDKQPYGGVCLYSVNGSTWESLQDTDLMFRINRAVFNTSDQVLRFEPIQEVDGIGEFLMLVTQRLPKGCSVDWQYSSDGVNWKSFKPTANLDEQGWEEQDEKVNLGRIVNNLYIRSILSTESDYVSPVISLDGITLFGGKFLDKGVYETKNVSVLPGVQFEEIRLWFWWKSNGGSLQSVQVSFDGGDTWYTLPFRTTYGVSQGYYEREYGGTVYSITSGAMETASTFKIRITYTSNLGWISPHIKNLRVVVF